MSWWSQLTDDFGSTITPPQARQVGGQKAKLDRKLLKLFGPQSFSKDVSRLKIDIDMLKVDIPNNDKFPDEVVVHLDVLCPSMEY